jgi:Na+/phosphate symporter
VLGANLGSAVNPLIEVGRSGVPASRRLPLGNLLNRMVGIIIALPLLDPLARGMTALQPDAARVTAEFHMLFNVALAALFIGPLGCVAWLLERILPDQPQPQEPAAPRDLDKAALQTPPLAPVNTAPDIRGEVAAAIVTVQPDVSRQVPVTVDRDQGAVRWHLLISVAPDIKHDEGHPRSQQG